MTTLNLAVTLEPTGEAYSAPRAEAPEVSVVIPCLNEAQSIGFCVDKALSAFRDMGIVGEVVVSDNGSTDGSVERNHRSSERSE